MGPPATKNESARLEALRRYKLLDTQPDRILEDLIKLASFVCATPIALLTLVDESRQWFKARVGFSLAETSREVSFCAHAILQEDAFTVPDALLDARFAANPLVTGSPNIRFYAGIPLVTPDGYALGTVCVMDRKPRELSKGQKDALWTLAGQVMLHLELHRALTDMETTLSRSRDGPSGDGAETTAANPILRFWGLASGVAKVNEVLRNDLIAGAQARDALRESEERFRILVETASDAIITVDSSSRILFANSATQNIFGYSPAELIGQELTLLMPEYLRHVHLHALEKYLKTGHRHMNWQGVELQGLHRSGREIALGIAFGESTSRGRHTFTGIIRDISQRKIAEEALRQERATLDDVLQLSPDHIYFKDRHSRFVRINPAQAKWLGLKDPVEALGKSDLDFFSSEHAQEALEDEQAIMRTGQPVSAKEEKETWPDGRTTWVVTTKTPLFDHHGQVVGLMGVSRNITEAKKAEALAQMTNERLGMALEASGHSFWDWDAAAGKVYLDKRWSAMLGGGPGETNTTVEELLGITHPDDRERALKSALEAVKGKTPSYREEHRVRDLTGNWIWIESTGKVVERDHSGRALRMIGTNSDITARKSSEAAIKESFERYRLLFERNLAGVYRTTLEGRMLDCNDSFARILGYASSEEALAHSASEFYFADSDRQLFLDRLQKERSLTNHEFRLSRKDGSTGWALENVSLVQLEGAPAVLEGTIIDITSYKQLEKQFWQSQKLEGIGRLAGGVAHDFNNLLGVIIGYSELMLEKMEAANPMRAQVDNVLRASRRAASLIRQLLAFSRKQVLAPRVLDLNAVIADLTKMLPRVLGEDVHVHITPGSPLGRAKVDPAQIEQVIMNLAVNARDAMPNGGKLTIETANVQMDEAYSRTHSMRAGQYVTMAVTDTGIGMSEETQAHIFEPFYSTKEPGKGTGLGLSTVYGIVNQSGGHIWVDSELGRGTTFKIYLPIVDEPLSSFDDGGPVAGAPRGNETVLLVEDEDALRKLVYEYLNSKGYSVLETASGEEALEISKRWNGVIHLLLTDIIMSGMNGLELAGHLTQRRPEMKVLYASGYSNSPVLDSGRSDQNCHFIEKPFSLDALARAIRKALETQAL